MDGLSGLERVFKEEFINSKIQRCLVHVMRNVLYKVPNKYHLFCVMSLINLKSQRGY